MIWLWNMDLYKWSAPFEVWMKSSSYDKVLAWSWIGSSRQVSYSWEAIPEVWGAQTETQEWGKLFFSDNEVSTYFRLEINSESPVTSITSDPGSSQTFIASFADGTVSVWLSTWGRWGYSEVLFRSHILGAKRTVSSEVKWKVPVCKVSVYVYSGFESLNLRYPSVDGQV